MIMPVVCHGLARECLDKANFIYPNVRNSDANCKRVALWSPRRTATTSCKKVRRVFIFPPPARPVLLAGN